MGRKEQRKKDHCAYQEDPPVKGKDKTHRSNSSSLPGTSGKKENYVPEYSPPPHTDSEAEEYLHKSFQGKHAQEQSLRDTSDSPPEVSGSPAFFPKVRGISVVPAFPLPCSLISVL